MHAAIGVSEIIASLLLITMLVFYLWGWRRLRRALPGFATRPRLLAFTVGIAALTFAVVFPLPGWSNYLLAMRSLQKVLICMVAAPMLWLAAPVHVIRWGLRGRWPRPVHALGTAQSASRKFWRANLTHVSQPLVAWLLYVAVFLLWHDPTFTPFMLGAHPLHRLAPWLLLGAALLFWWPVINTGPRLHRTFPTWLFIAYLISVEVLNMVAGITIAFSVEPIYLHYTAVRTQLAPGALPWGPTTDQIMGGAIIWVFGSFVYFSAIVFVLFDLFRKDGSTTPQPLPDWDANAKFIAPGLEHRVPQNELRKVDLRHR